MKKSTGIRMLLRSPGKTIVTLVLIAAASFLFLYNLLDYAMTRRDYDRTYAAYHASFSVMRPEDRDVGSSASMFSELALPFLSNPAENPGLIGDYAYEDYHMRSLSAGDMQAIQDLPYVTRTEKRYMTGGLASFRRSTTRAPMTLVEFFSNTDRIVFTAVLDGLQTPRMAINFISPDWADGDGTEMTLKVHDVQVLAGNEDDLKQNRAYINHGRLGVMVAVLEQERARTDWPLFFDIMRPAAAFTRTYMTQADLEALVPGQRYLFVANVSMVHLSSGGISDDEDYMYTDPYVHVGDDSVYGTCELITPLEGEPENWLETEKFAGVRKMMEIIETDKRTLDVHYLEDMASLRRYQEGKLVPVEGRILTREDSENRNPVCVITELMAEEQHLSVGDTLHLELGDKLLEQYAPFGAVAYSPQRYADTWTGQDFTIVGTFTESGLERLSKEDQFWAYGNNAVMVPLSFLPETADTEHHEFKPPEVSFIVDDADSILPFRDDILPRLEEMGYYVYFFDGGWPAVRDSLRQAGSLSLVKLLAFTASAVLVLWLTVYLYILRKKKEYAVMRALGCTARRARGALLFPLLALAVPAILLGSLGAILYTHAAAERNAAEFAILGLTMDASIPPEMVALGFGGSLALLLILAFLALRSVASRPPLELLQEAVKKPRQAAPREDPLSVPAEPDMRAILDMPEAAWRGRAGLGQCLRYVGRKLRRTSVKALLCLLLALVLCFSIGYFALLRSSYRELYQNIEIHPRFLNGFSYNKALEVAKTGYVRDPYYEYRKLDCESDFVPDTLILTMDLSRVCSAEVVWREGLGPEIFQKSGSYCVISRELADALGVDINGKVHFCTTGKIGLLAQSHPDLSYEELVEVYNESNGKLTVAGISEEEGFYAYGPIAAWQHLQNLFADYVPLSYAEYTLNDYHKATEFRSYAWRAIYGSRAEFSMETQEADRVYQTYRLLELLFPIAFVLALILGAVLPAGVILQSAKEASLLRVLGTAKGRTRSMLSLEQIFLCLLGILLAGLGLAAVKGSALGQVKELLAVYAGAHFLLCALAAFLASAAVTRRRVLELLQTKE